MRKRLTLADVARSAGVSMMTVSRAINNKPGLSDELRQKILQIAVEIGYQAESDTREQSSQRTFTIGVIVADITIPFFSQIVRGIEDVCYEFGYHMYLANTGEDLERERHALNDLLQHDLDGAILCSPRAPMDELVAILQQLPAAVLINRDVRTPLPNVVTVNVNDQRGAQSAVQHLIAIGRKRIAYIGGPANSTSNQRRHEGYRQALKNANIAYDPQLVVNVLNVDGVRPATQELLNRFPELDGIFLFSDQLAISVMQTCQENGRSIPIDIALVSADDIPLASAMRPQLTTLRVNLSHIGRLSMRTLLEMIEGEATAASFQIEPELIIRSSSQPS